MSDQFQVGVGFYIAETASGAYPYGSLVAGSLPTISGNVMTAEHGYKSGTIGAGTDEPTPLSYNLCAIEKVGTQHWGGAVGDTEYFYFGHGTGLRFKMSDTTGGAEKWKIDVTDNAGTSVGTGTTEYACASSANVTGITLIRESTRVRVWVNGVKEVDASGISSTGAPGAGITRLGGGTAHAGKNWYIGRILRLTTDTADRYIDPTALTFAKVIGNGEGTDTAYATVYPAATNKWDDVDDWNAGVSDDGDGASSGTTIQSGSTDGTTYRQSLATADFSVSGAVGVMVYARQRVTVSAKTPSLFVLVRDATNRTDSSGTTFALTAYQNLFFPFYLAPGGGAWSSFNFNNLELGVGITIAGGVNSALCTVMEAEVFGVTTYLSDAAAVTRRRTGPTLMSPGVF